MGDQKPRVGGWSPWGRIGGVEEVAEGMTFVSTASHGGVKISAARRLEIPKAFHAAGCWYEEDCDAAVPLYFCDFPKSQREKDSALRVLLTWKPDQCRSIGLIPEALLPDLERAADVAYYESMVAQGHLLRVVGEPLSQTEGDRPVVRLRVRGKDGEFEATVCAHIYESQAEDAALEKRDTFIRRIDVCAC